MFVYILVAQSSGGDLLKTWLGLPRQDLKMIPQTDLSEWGSDGLLKDPVGGYPHRPLVRRSTFVRRLRTWGHLLSSRLLEMVAHTTLTEKTQWF